MFVLASVRDKSKTCVNEEHVVLGMYSTVDYSAYALYLRFCITINHDRNHDSVSMAADVAVSRRADSTAGVSFHK